jgi:hypothetical protein
VADGGLPLYRICEECGERTYTYEQCHNCGDVPWVDEQHDQVRTDGGRSAYRRECVDAVRQEAGVADDGPCPHGDPDCPGPYAEDGLPCADCFLDDPHGGDEREELVADGGREPVGLEEVDAGLPDPEDVDWGPIRKPLEEGDPCPECGHPFDPDEWDVRHLHGGASLGETWIYSCPGCGQETAEVGT